jgi:hypothetical protein
LVDAVGVATGYAESERVAVDAAGAETRAPLCRITAAAS